MTVNQASLMAVSEFQLFHKFPSFSFLSDTSLWLKVAKTVWCNEENVAFL